MGVNEGPSGTLTTWGKKKDLLLSWNKVVIESCAFKTIKESLEISSPPWKMLDLDPQQ